MLDVACIRPPDFDLAEYWRASTARFIETRSRYQATLRLHPQAAARVKAWRMCAATDAGEDVSDNGWTTLHLRFEDEEQARFVALGFGPKARVLAPDSLRQRVADDLAAMAPTLANRASRAIDRENGG
jgi:predicted DNA-binding transcriptional regulator YafY